MKLILRSILIPLFCLMGSTAFAQQKANEVKIYIPKDAIKIESGKIIIGRDGSGFRVKALYSNKSGFYIYKKDALLPKVIAKGRHLYRCSKCRGLVFDDLRAAELHNWGEHGGWATITEIR